SHLVRNLATLPTNAPYRIRLSSIEATEVTTELIGVMCDHANRIVPHIHLCLQSGSDSVLRRMRRRWGTRMFLDRCQKLRDALDHPALTTDVIVGFPGETDDEFQETMRTCRSAGFSKIHVFPFSPRRGTPAADMPPIDGGLKKHRVAELIQLQNQLRDEFHDSLIGRRLQMLVENVDPENGVCRGTSARFAPLALHGQSSMSSDTNPPQLGQLIDVVATKRDNDHLIVVPTNANE
ncbi:MAG: radical SAM protein, partial [Planctomycetota bacterium]